jgi:molecular chaperone HtpG
MDHKFQINLGGLIDLLSNHLYSGPEVYVRELLQNGVDAIRARCGAEPDHRGEIVIEAHAPRGKPPTLIFHDDGIGLTEDEVHRFLATIGESSKRVVAGDRPADFIGQFGIGLLSCFVVSEEIVVVSRSARPGGRPLEWRGRPDGTYSLKPIEADLAPGTQVFLTAKDGCEEHFQPDRVRDLARHFGGLLPFPVRVTAGKQSEVVNSGGAPWRARYPSAQARSRALLDFGREAFGLEFFDAIPLHSSTGAVDGVAYVLPFTPNLATRRAHRVYLKNMLLSEKADNLLPEWAFFVKAVVNANDLRPTASRESFYEDAKLIAARTALGECLRSYLVQLAEHDRAKLGRLIALHHLSIKALAVRDDDFYRLFINWLPFETSQGEMTLSDYVRQSPTIRYVPTVDEFRQVAQVAAAQGACVINGGYTYHTELLERYSEVFPEVSTERVSSEGLSRALGELGAEEQEEAQGLLASADEALRSFRCSTEVRTFRPENIPALYVTSGEGRFFRSLEQSKEVANPLWGSVLDSLGRRPQPVAPARLTFNFRNPLVRRLASVTDRSLVRRAVQLLYVQALLLGHHPLTTKETTLLNDGMLALIEASLGTREGRSDE